MRKAVSLSTFLVLLGLLLILVAPAAPSFAQGNFDNMSKQNMSKKGAPLSHALVNPLLDSGSCSIDCGDGSHYDTDAGTVIGCACDCAAVCGGTCEATDGQTTRTCSNN
jgi:hypothetical protein